MTFARVSAIMAVKYTVEVLSMTYAQGLKRGASLCFSGCYDESSLSALRDAGIECVELSFNFDKFMNVIRFPERWQECAELAERVGVELWSIHLPFSQVLDISSPEEHYRAITYYTHTRLIEAAGKAGVKVAVLHPGAEPISLEERSERLANSRDGIRKLREACDRAGLLLAVETLPRTCLCNSSSEMIELLRGTGAGIVFDTNHSLGEDNVAFLAALADSGIPIYSLHISDYDFVDERHRLPGDGCNDWSALISILERAGYSGPLMYEVVRQPQDREPITEAQLGENMRSLAAGEIHATA